MRKTRKIVVALCLYASLCATALGQKCGKERWTVKTGTDSDVIHVNLSNTQSASISDLIVLPAPNPIPTNSRFASTEETVFVVNATLTDYKIESDSDYHLVLQDDQGNTMIAEIPSPSCVGAGSPFASQIANARAEFDAQLQATSSFQTANVPVRVTGVGFFDFFHGQHGAAPNVIELHPVLDIQFNPQPLADDFVLSATTSAMHLHANSSASLGLSTSLVDGGTVPNVKFAVQGLPSGVTSKINSGANGKTNLVFSAPATSPGGTFPVTITASANGHSHSQTVALNLSNAPEIEGSPTWEYRMITATSDQDVINQASKLGAEGWEMVSVVRATGDPAWRAFFKRASKD